MNVETVSDSEAQSATANRVVNRDSAIAMIVNTANSCPFKYSSNSFMCLYCEERYSEFPSLHQHVIAVHDKISETDIRKAVGRTKKDHKIKMNFSAFTCKICDGNFDGFKDLKMHIIEKHEQPVDVIDDGVLPYRIRDGAYDCVLCGTTFKNYVALNRHINSHFPYFVCNQCGVGCATARRLREHKAYNHTDRSYPCDVCPKTFPTASRMKRHTTKVHLKLMSNKCTMCSVTFTSSDEKGNHMKTAHGKKFYLLDWSLCKLINNKKPLKMSSMTSQSMVSHRIGDQNLLSRAPPCFGRHVKPLVPDAFAVDSTHILIHSIIIS
jgi:hypothetical protein